MADNTKTTTVSRETEQERIIELMIEKLSDENIHRLYVAAMALWMTQE